MIRLALAETGVKYKNIFVPDQESLEECKRKGGHLTTNIPMLTVDGVHYTQSLAILRKIGREFAGGRLHPANQPDLLYQIDMLIDTAFDLRILCYDTYNNSISSRPKMSAFANEVQSTHLPNLARLLSGGPYMCGSDFTLADISVYDALANWVERLLPGVLARFPTLHSYVIRVMSRPSIAAWLASAQAAEIGKEDGEEEGSQWELAPHGVKAMTQAKKRRSQAGAAERRVAKKPANRSR